MHCPSTVGSIMNDQTTMTLFHRGEREVQEHVGAREFSERVGRRMIRDRLPGDHKAFLSQLPFVLIGAIDAEGRPWASILVGQAGFISAPDAQTLRIETRLIDGDPLQKILSEGADVGLLGIEYHNRIRVRVNGKIRKIDDESITISVEHAFGNCPQYIQSRSYELLPGIASIGEPRATLPVERLDERARQIIANADHFFIATHFSDNSGDESHGADVSHRGGKPGFVRIEDERTLTFPDFRGNNFFNTLGNIAANPRAGVLFIDFERGDLLYLTCAAEIVWGSEESRAFKGSQRLVKLTMDEGVLVEQALPIRWSFEDYSRSLKSTGSWEEVDAELGR